MAWDSGPTIAPESYARMRAHPRYPEAVRRFARNMLAGSDADRALDGMLKDAGRTMAGFSAVYLHASGGLTLPRLKAMLAGFNLASPGRARTLLLYLHYLGYVELRPVRAHGQPALYTPTACFLGAYREHMRAVVDAVSVLEPAVGLMLDGFDLPGVFESFVAHNGDAFMRQEHRYPAYFRVFMHRYAGIQIMHTLLVASAADVFPPERPIAFSAAEAARRFKVSGPHVRRLLDAGAAEGLLAVNTGALQFTPEGRAAVDWIFATQMIQYLTCAVRTLQGHPELLRARGAGQAA